MIRGRFRRPGGVTSSTTGDDVLLRSAARTVALQAAVAVAVTVAVVAGAALFFDAHARTAEAARAVRSTWASAEDVDDPPVGVYLISVSATGRREITPGAPAAVRTLDPNRLPDAATVREVDDTRLVIFTGDRDRHRFAAVTSLDSFARQRVRILESLGLAMLLGVAGAAAVGALIGRRAVRPLGAGMALQRRFVTDASHELRTPLTVLLTRTQILRRRLPADTPSGVLAEVDRIAADVKNLGDVVSDLLLSAELQHRPRAGEEVDAAALADDVVDTLQPMAHERGVALTSDLPVAADLATPITITMPITMPITMRGAPAALRRALTSLADNALAHTPEGGHVVVQVRAEGADVVLRVIDDGEGIDPAVAARLVQRFARDTENDDGRRFGLGLALVEEVARAHGGRLEIDGRPGEGSRFTLRLPLLRCPGAGPTQRYPRNRPDRWLRRQPRRAEPGTVGNASDEHDR